MELLNYTEIEDTMLGTQHEETLSERIYNRSHGFLHQLKTPFYYEENSFNIPNPEGNIWGGVIGGILAALAGIFIWAESSLLFDHEYAYMALLVGIVVGLAVRYAGMGADLRYAVVATLLTIVGCVGGYTLSILGMIANNLQITYMETYNILDSSFVWHLMQDRFALPDILFYLISCVIAFVFSYTDYTDILSDN